MDMSKSTKITFSISMKKGLYFNKKLINNL